MDTETLDTPLVETQATIAEWGRQTFGRHPAMGMATRCNVEMAELLEKLAGPDPELRRLVLRQIELAEAISARHHALVDAGDPMADAVRDVTGALDECYDVGIVIDQVVDSLGGDMVGGKTRKMRVNRGRTWKRLPSGRHQHS